jgi:hypothetical protein
MGGPAVSASTCTDTRCTDGVTWCPGCNGHGVVNPKGKRYRIAHRGPLPTWAIPHPDCNGTGLRACGCRPLSPAERATLTGHAIAS